VKLVRDGLDRVLAQRSKVTATLKEYIVSHDAVRDRELEQTLRQVESELMTWMAATGPRATHDVPLLPARASVDHLRERFYDPADDVLPERIVAADDEAAPALSLSSLMSQGGPQLPALRRRLDDALADLVPAGSLGEVFDGLEASLRRPVEIFGLLHLAADHDWQPEDATESYASVRPDGSRRTFAVPRLPLPDPDLNPDPSPDPGPAPERKSRA
jgi:hypothetical protein